MSLGAAERDLVIVGGGPAGLSTALFLAHASPGAARRIAVVERDAYPRDKTCAGAVGGRADRALAAIGVHIDVPSVAVRGLSVVTPAGRLVARRDRPIGRVVRRREFDAALAAAAEKRGIEIWSGAPVREIRRDDHGCVVGLGGRSLRVRAVIGADGVGSIVRRSVSLGRGSLIAQAVEVDTPAAVGDPAADLLHFDVTDPLLRGYAWDFPTLVEGRRLVCRGVYELRTERPSGEPRPGREPDVSARLTRYLDERRLVADRATYKRFAERGLSLHEATAVPRTLLVGEAAGIDPVLGEGIAQAILYGQVAGAYLARCLRENRYTFSDWPKVLAASRVGLDLGIRTRLAPWVYDRARPLAERFVARSHPFAHAGLHYFAGERVPRVELVRAALTLGRLAVNL